MEKEKYKNKLTSVQRLINTKMSKAYRTVSSEALCVVTGMTPIHIKIEEPAKTYQYTRGLIKDKSSSITIKRQDFGSAQQKLL